VGNPAPIHRGQCDPVETESSLKKRTLQHLSHS